MRIISLVIFSLIIGFAGGYFVVNSKTDADFNINNCQEKYEFINARLSCQPKPVLRKHEYTQMESDLNAYIEKEQTAKHINRVSVYYRDLYSGPTFGINSSDEFIPASLLKLPVLITYLSLAEENKSLLNKEITFPDKSEDVLEQSTNGTVPILKTNTPYKIDDLLTRMIVYSDNLAYAGLSDYLDVVYKSEMPLRQSMIDLGLLDPRDPNENTITVKGYASIFRQLYNSSYLSPEMSEKALTLLIRTSYDKGLAAGIPKDMKLANKFGERTDDKTNEKQLHDCGIIYYPHNPYLLCIMTKGDNLDEQTEVIKTISEKVYKEVDSRKY